MVLKIINEFFEEHKTFGKIIYALLLILIGAVSVVVYNVLNNWYSGISESSDLSSGETQILSIVLVSLLISTGLLIIIYIHLCEVKKEITIKLEEVKDENKKTLSKIKKDILKEILESKK